MKNSNDSLIFGIDHGYGDAMKHRKSTGKYLRPYKWEDLTVDVCI